MTLEQYIRDQYATGAIDFRFRAAVIDARVEIYIHPLNRDGVTTPMLLIEGNTVRVRPFEVEK